MNTNKCTVKIQYRAGTIEVWTGVASGTFVVEGKGRVLKFRGCDSDGHFAVAIPTDQILQAELRCSRSE